MSADLYSLLDIAGYRVRGRRADCPHCEGRSRLTVSISRDEVFFCHRCGRSGNVRTLARELGRPLSPQTQAERAALRRREDFDAWTNERHKQLAGQYRSLARTAERAKLALKSDPDWEPAWEQLANFYHQESRLSAALDTLTFQSTSRWLDFVPTPAQLEETYAAERYRQAS